MPYGVSNQDLFNNAQFQNFVEFAQTSKAGSIAKTTTAPLVPDDKPHSITGSSESIFSKLFFRSKADHRLMNVMDSLPQEFKIEASCNVDISMKVITGADD